MPGADLACGAGTDQFGGRPDVTLDHVVGAYEEQLGFIEGQGGRAILMASRALARAARAPDDYADVYGRILRQARDKVILHWLGDMFDPQLAGYWGGADFDRAVDAVLSPSSRSSRARSKASRSRCSTRHARSRCAAGCRTGCVMFTGDDFNYAELIEGDGQGFSHALLGIFDPIAPAASAALVALDGGDAADVPPHPRSRPCRCRARSSRRRPSITRPASSSWPGSTATRIISPCSAACNRPARIAHYAEVFRLADQAGLLIDPDLACARMGSLLAVNGIGQ